MKYSQQLQHQQQQQQHQKLFSFKDVFHELSHLALFPPLSTKTSVHTQRYPFFFWAAQESKIYNFKMDILCCWFEKRT